MRIDIPWVRGVLFRAELLLQYRKILKLTPHEIFALEYVRVHGKVFDDGKDKGLATLRIICKAWKDAKKIWKTHKSAIEKIVPWLKEEKIAMQYPIMTNILCTVKKIGNDKNEK